MAVGAGLLCGAIVALISQMLNFGLAVDIPLLVICAAGLGVFLAGGRHGIW